MYVCMCVCAGVHSCIIDIIQMHVINWKEEQENVDMDIRLHDDKKHGKEMTEI